MEKKPKCWACDEQAIEHPLRFEISEKHGKHPIPEQSFQCNNAKCIAIFCSDLIVCSTCGDTQGDWWYSMGELNEDDYTCFDGALHSPQDRHIKNMVYCQSCYFGSKCYNKYSDDYEF